MKNASDNQPDNHVFMDLRRNISSIINIIANKERDRRAACQGLMITIPYNSGPLALQVTS